MKKLVLGIVEFRQKVLPKYRKMFAELAIQQTPDSLFIACSDSRVVPNLFASTDPGDLFVIRNVGNLIPCCSGPDGHSSADESEAAAIEFALLNLNVKDIIVCGHSECGAMHAILSNRDKIQTAPNLKAWLRHGEPTLNRLTQKPENLTEVNYLSQQNVLQQIEHLKSYPIVQEKISQGELQLHAWWFELSTAFVYAYEESMSQFILIDEEEAARIMSRLK